MSLLSFDEFAGYAGEFSVIPVFEELLNDTVTPIGAFEKVVGDDDGFLFESAEHGGRFGRYSFLGRSPRATLVARGKDLQVTKGAIADDVPRDRGVLVCLEGLLSRLRSPRVDGLPPLHGGIVGYLGYDVVREIERLGDCAHDDRGLPDAVVSIVGEVVALDHFTSRVFLVDNVILESSGPMNGSNSDLRAHYDEARAHLTRLRRDLEVPHAGGLSNPPARSIDIESVNLRRVVEHGAFRQAVLTAKEHIWAGDAFQIVLSQRFDLDLGADPFDVYRVLRQVNPSPYMYFLRQGGVCIVGASPEPMVQLLDNRVISRPIAGTRPRGRTDEEDRRLAGELAEHPKEIAEHVMLVDLARNDVGRVVKFGTERVDELMTLERYSHVMHLTSQVSGELVSGLGPIDVLRATFPAGTVSGAPKVRAMEIIDELETTKRGPYAGVVGYVDFSGNLDTAITIRTLVVDAQGQASVQAGAGIVADSDPEAEDLECENKARAILAAVAGAQRLVAERDDSSKSMSRS